MCASAASCSACAVGCGVVIGRNLTTLLIATCTSLDLLLAAFIGLLVISSGLVSVPACPFVAWSRLGGHGGSCWCWPSVIMYCVRSVCFLAFILGPASVTSWSVAVVLGWLVSFLSHLCLRSSFLVLVSWCSVSGVASFCGGCGRL